MSGAALSAAASHTVAGSTVNTSEIVSRCIHPKFPMVEHRWQCRSQCNVYIQSVYIERIHTYRKHTDPIHVERIHTAYSYTYILYTPHPFSIERFFCRRLDQITDKKCTVIATGNEGNVWGQHRTACRGYDTVHRCIKIAAWWKHTSVCV